MTDPVQEPSAPKAAPPMPQDVAAVFDAYPPSVAAALAEMRALVFRAARDTGTGPLSETLKWGQPAYLTAATGAGTTIRLGRDRATGRPAVFFNCRTGLIAGFREQFGREFEFRGNRALMPRQGADLPADALAICLARALTYHRAKSGGGP